VSHRRQIKVRRHVQGACVSNVPLRRVTCASSNKQVYINLGTFVQLGRHSRRNSKIKLVVDFQNLEKQRSNVLETLEIVVLWFPKRYEKHVRTAVPS